MDEYPKVEWKWILKKDLPFLDACSKLGWCNMYQGSKGFFVRELDVIDSFTKMGAIGFRESQDWLLQSILDRKEWIEVI